MSLLSLSNKLLLEIAGYFKYESDMNSLMQVTDRLYYLLGPYLYRFNARYHKGSALKWAFENNRASAVQKALEAAIPKAGETPKNNTRTESMEGFFVLSPGWNLQPQKSEGGDCKPKYWLRIKQRSSLYKVLVNNQGPMLQVVVNWHKRIIEGEGS